MVSLQAVEEASEANWALLDEIAGKTAPPTYLRAFCEDDNELSDLYDEMVYEGTDNINHQAHRQREF